MTESQFKNKVVARLKRELPGCWVYHPTDRWVSGIPDLLILYNGRFAAVELKVKNNQPTKLQAIILLRIIAAGGIAQVCRSMDNLEGIVAKIKGGTNE